MNQKPELLIAIAVPPGDTDTDQLISQISQVLLRREAPRDRSYQGPSTTLCLLRRTLPTKALGTQRTGSYQGFVRFASITQNPIPSTTSSLSASITPAASAASNNPAASAASYNPDTVCCLPCRSATSKITSTTRPKRQRTLSPSTAFASHEHHDLRQSCPTQESNVRARAMGLP